MGHINRIISNTNWFDAYNCDYKIVNIRGKSIIRSLFNALKYSANDVVILNISSRLLIYFCIIKLFNKNFNLISIDIILSKPISLYDRIKSAIMSHLFEKVNYFIVYMKEWSGYKRYYKIKTSQLHYIPFKVNSIEKIANIKTRDGNYIFTGGMSKRDYETLFKAVEGLDISVKCLLPSMEICKRHGTFINTEIPSNVALVHDNGETDSWNNYISAAKFVVIPISKETISPTGISTYLVAMACKKCVIVTKGPSTIDVIPDECSVQVEPANVASLRNAILHVFNDETYRKLIADNGYRYAQSLQGHSRLVSDIICFIDDKLELQEAISPLKVD